MKARFDPTDEQQSVLDAKDPHLAVVASAGAGKTRVLVERYLAHVLQDKIDPDRILTITFTRKAAAEMKKRIVEGLREARAFDEAQVAETGPIQTIHALCEQLLRENSIQAGLNTKFEILSEAQSSRIQMEVVEEAIATLSSDSAESERLIGKLAGKRSFGTNSPYAFLQRSILEGLDGLRGFGLDRRLIREIYQDPASFRKYWQQTMISSLPSPVLEGLGSLDGAAWRENLKPAFKAARMAVPNWVRNVKNTREDLELERSTCGVVQIVLVAWEKWESRMRTLQAFDFTALESLTVSLLEDHPEIRAAIQRKFEIVMVDEAQDLNPNQHRLINGLNAKRLLTVGDGQQSIYGFRHADLDLFYKNHSIDAKRLTKNHRSDPGILRFIDRLFGEIWKDTYLPMLEKPRFDLDTLEKDDFAGVEFWEVPPQGLAKIADHISHLIEVDQVNPGDICVLARNSRSCQIIHEALTAKKIAAQVHGATERFYTRMEVRDMANTLRSLAAPYHDYSLLAVLRGPMVGLSEDGMSRLALHKPVWDNLLTVDLNPQDRTQVESFLEWFGPLRKYADRLSAWEAMSEIFARTPFLAALAGNPGGSQQVANVRKLLVLASKEKHLGPLEFANQIREIQELRHKEGDAEDAQDQNKRVRLMTIHKSKGLEFPIVILPETNRKLVNESSKLLFDSKLGLLASHFEGGLPGLLYSFLAERRKEQDLAEEMRVLYVAMTRAQKRLCIAIYPSQSQDTVSKRVRRIIGEPFPNSIRFRPLLKEI